MYSRAAWMARVQGDVLVEVRISAEGKVLSTAPLSGRPILQEAAVTNVRKWVFNSGTERTIQVLFQFKLQGAEADIDIPEISYDLPDRVIVVSRPPTSNMGE